jgi:hypothetical protein
MAGDSRGCCLRLFRLALRAAASFSGEDLGMEIIPGKNGNPALSFAESLRYSSAPLGSAAWPRNPLRPRHLYKVRNTTVAVVA